MRGLLLLSSVLVLALGGSLGCSKSPQADEPIEDHQKLINDGYQPVPPPVGAPGPLPPLNPDAPLLAWPVTFQDQAHSLGNSMLQFQQYSGAAYFHGGNDLRVKAGAEVRAPIAGRIEAGHYSYSTKSDGSMQKYWLPWPQAGNRMYFEVAVIADDGTRYEFHHVNRDNLPQRVIDLVESGGRVEAGEVVGYTIPWSDGVYHHIHYNVITANGVTLNPEFISEPIPDSLAPEILHSYAIMKSGTVKSFGDGEFTERPEEFVIGVIDRKDKNVYTNPPTWARLIFSSGEVVEWDFRRSLHLSDGKMPSLWDVYAKSIRTPSGATLKTTGTYGTGLSLIRLKVPASARGGFTIVMGDILGNQTSLSGFIP